MTISEPTASAEAQDTSDTGSRVTTQGNRFGALAMISCCILPLALIGFGFGVIWIAQLTALYAYKWYAFAVAASFIGYGFWKVHRAEVGECRDGATCARPLNRRIMKASLWLGAVVTAMTMVFPYILKF